MINTVPMSTWEAYEWARVQAEVAGRPDAVLPLPGEPYVLDETTQGGLKVWASDGQRHGWYHVAGDRFDVVA